MIRVFYGEDRIKTEAAIKKLFGKDYEIIEAETLSVDDLASVFMGTTLFGDTRKILIKGLNENKECWNKLDKFTDTPHDVVIWLSNLDKRSATYKELVKKVEFKEFALPEKVDKFLAFKIADEAFAGRGNKAVKMCEQIEITDDPYLTMGAIISQALKKLEMRNSKAARALKILAKADLAMKNSAIDGWQVVKVALLEIGNL